MRAFVLIAIPAALALSACGKADDSKIVVTNDNNVVLNDATADHAYTNDGETAANDAAASNATGNAM